ncbi:actin-related protein 6-like [Bolinopsis microptera]|uniref:actin-related protein 6-like n=1 Tax=Bolinopsis microptera TaxID=2820187 RepID=UPI00307953B3
MAEKCLILDNGSHTVKCGWRSDKSPENLYNWIMRPKDRRRQFVGTQIDGCQDMSNIHITCPFQKGYLLNWTAQKTIWDSIFSDPLKVSPGDTNLIVTEPPLNFTSIQEAWDEVIFEEYGFKSLFRCSASTLTAFHYKQTHTDNQCCLIVDAGHAFTHIIPYHNGKQIIAGTKRINVGGKHMCNLLKELISYRQLNLLEETYACNLIKEDVCFVSTSFNEELELAKKKDPSVLCEYVLPDFVNIHRGYVNLPDVTDDPDEAKKPVPTKEQMIRLSLERFTVPEILFNPSDIGIEAMGLTEAIVHAIRQCPVNMQPHLYNNIVIIGGSSKFQNFKERIIKDVRSCAPDEFNINVYRPEDPIVEAWKGGQLLGGWPGYHSIRVTKSEYEDSGPSVCAKKLYDSIPVGNT